MNKIVRIQPMQYIHLLDLVSTLKLDTSLVCMQPDIKADGIVP